MMKRIGFLFDERLYGRLGSLAKQYKRSRTDLIRDMIYTQMAAGGSLLRCPYVAVSGPNLGAGYALQKVDGHAGARIVNVDAATGMITNIPRRDNDEPFDL